MKQLPLMMLFRLGALAVVLALAGALSFGYLGWLHPAFDAFAHFRIHLSVLLLAGVPVLLVLRFWPEAVFAALLAFASIVSTTGMPFSSALPAATASTRTAPDGAAVYRLFHANLRFDNQRPEAILSLIGETRPDVLTLNEVSEHWHARLQALEGVYPYRIFCPRHSPIGSAAILSRRPFVHGTAPYCADRGSFAHAQVDFGGRAVDVVTLHLGWPWPFDQPWQVRQAMPFLADVGHTAVFAGDLNAVPWSNTAKLVAAALDAHPLRGIGPTWLTARLPDFLRPLIGLPIDNVMVKGGILPVSVGTLKGGSSDHLPVLLEFIVLPQEQPMPAQHVLALSAR